MSSTIDFILGDGPSALPGEACYHAKRSLLDLIGVWAAARDSDTSRIIYDHAAAHFGPGRGEGARGASLVFDGRAVSPPGAALAGAMTIDALDGHDGYRLSKGHAGCSLLPAMLGLWEGERLPPDPRAFLAAFVLGYEISCRVATQQHASVADYHSSGSWGAVGVAAVGARLLGLDRERTRHALGIAEYHGPRAQMMRIIDHPTMVKDSSGWGAMAGVSALYLARDGFTGAPAILVEGQEESEVWRDLGRRWLMCEQYFKPWPVCRWAQPPLQAALDLRAAGLDPAQIEEATITTFHEAVRLAGPRPLDSDQAQYSINFPVACALVHGVVGPAQIMGEGLRDEAVLAMAGRIRLAEDPEIQASFPARRIARLDLVLKDGTRLSSGLTQAHGDPENPMTDGEVREKFRSLAAPALGEACAAGIEASVGDFSNPEDLDLQGLLNQLWGEFGDLRSAALG
ncbi:MmgE/PrpD family protein [Limibacillus halophilus]